MATLNVQLIDKRCLTTAEGSVLVLLCLGKTRKAIAALRNTSKKTIDAQIDSIAMKLDAHSSVEIVAKAVAKNMISISLRTFLLCWLSFGVATNETTEKRRAPNYRCRSVERIIRVRDI